MLERLWKKFVNRETISYFIFGVLTTLVDWISYWLMRKAGNKLFVFCCLSLHPKKVWAEFVPFVICRVATGVFTMVAMIVLVDGIGIRHDFICKVGISGISLILNYLFSKLFIFRKAS